MKQSTPPDIDVLSYGESLIDFLPARKGAPLADIDSFRKTVGGAPTNLALGVGRLGRHSALLGMVGADPFGDFIVDSLDESGVCTDGIRRTDRGQTGLAFVSLDDDGDRSFLFYRDDTADTLFSVSDVDDDLIGRSRIVQIGSNLLTDENLRQTTRHVLDVATSAGCLVSVDANIRLDLWPSDDEARRETLALADAAEIFKCNEEELELLTGGLGPRDAWEEIFAPRGVELLVVTLGSDGAWARNANTEVSVEAPAVAVRDTTGAGDGFLSGFLSGLSAILDTRDAATHAAKLSALETSRVASILRLGCHVGSTVCTRLGATPPLPNQNELPEELAQILEQT